jgi:hypothetical protein
MSKMMALYLCSPYILFFVERVWQCGCGCFLNNFSCQNTCQWCFFYFLKIIFNISTSKWSKTYKPYSILVEKKNFQNFWERCRSHVPKHSRSLLCQIIASTIDMSFKIMIKKKWKKDLIACNKSIMSNHEKRKKAQGLN